MQNMISACKPHQSQPPAALLPPPRPVLPGRAAFPRLPARDTTSRLVVRRRCQEEDKQQQQQQQQEQEAAEGSGADEQERRTFLSLEEAGLVEMSGLSTHERFLCRLTEGVPIEELNAGRVCDWFIKDKLKREQNIGTAVLQWDDPGL
ncbi:hypothetical protein PAHAL_7G305700 [Panicum hallii]|uniref:Uncharacterized protein n=1 Tax=Panicum hallii TaxID=206008 RepID=A0A2T8IE27_9POAL|nr:hypothetical protein PAHAL_7G305700 [Panicum hallii]